MSVNNQNQCSSQLAAFAKTVSDVTQHKSENKSLENEEASKGKSVQDVAQFKERINPEKSRGLDYGQVGKNTALHAVVTGSIYGVAVAGARAALASSSAMPLPLRVLATYGLAPAVAGAMVAENKARDITGITSTPLLKPSKTDSVIGPVAQGVTAQITGPKIAAGVTKIVSTVAGGKFGAVSNIAGQVASYAVSSGVAGGVREASAQVSNNSINPEQPKQQTSLDDKSSTSNSLSDVDKSAIRGVAVLPNVLLYKLALVATVGGNSVLPQKLLGNFAHPLLAVTASARNALIDYTDAKPKSGEIAKKD